MKRQSTGLDYSSVTARLDADRLGMARRILGAKVKDASTQTFDKRVTIAVAYDDLDESANCSNSATDIEVIIPEEARQYMFTASQLDSHRHTPQRVERPGRCHQRHD